MPKCIVKIECTECNELMVLHFTKEMTKISTLINTLSKYNGHKLNCSASLDPVLSDMRPMINYLSNEHHVNFSKKLSGAEIGVEDGKHAKSILDNLPIQKLYLIDPYIPYIEDGKLLDYRSKKGRL